MPKSSTRLPLLALAAAATIAACGGGNTGPSGGGSGTLSATINGSAWVASPQLIQFPTPQKQGHYPMYGSVQAGGTLNGLTFNLIGITGPGTYPLGTTGGVSGGVVSVNEGSSIWQTPLSGEAGEITLTTLTATRMAGRFNFVATGVANASGTRTVTNGLFDIPITVPGNLPAMTQADTGHMKASLGGTPWNAAGGGGGAPANGALFVIFLNDKYSVALTLAPYNGPGVYQLGGANVGHRLAVAQGTLGNSPCCWGGRTQFQNGQIVSLDAGTITISTPSPNRIHGVFSANLAPALTGTATANLQILGGTFTYGFP